MHTLSDVLSQAPKDTIISGKDINTQLGCTITIDNEGSTSLSKVTGPFSHYAHPNECGMCIACHTAVYNLISSPTWFKKWHYGTHFLHLTKEYLQLDHIFVSAHAQKTVISCTR
eukprot:10854563-Ditylum_brightwellii.AAC.1